VTSGGLVARELAPGVTQAELTVKTGCPVDVSALNTH
jgi:acyl CoA:acetate/3-ketoacid CoA transferase beta subunit